MSKHVDYYTWDKSLLNGGLVYDSDDRSQPVPWTFQSRNEDPEHVAFCEHRFPESELLGQGGTLITAVHEDGECEAHHPEPFHFERNVLS